MPKFRVGQRVVVLTETHGWGRVIPGMIGEVVNVPDYGDMCYTVIFRIYGYWRGQEICFRAAEVEEAEVEERVAVPEGVCAYCGEELGEDTNETTDGTVCEECIEHYESCAECGDNFRKEGMIDTEDGLVCEPCFEEYYRTCDDCGTKSKEGCGTVDGWVCNSCYNENYHTCARCNDVVPADDTTWVSSSSGDTVRWCAHCSDTFAHRCGDCGQYFTRSAMVTDDICDRCFSDHYGTCGGCGEPVHNDDSYYDEDADEDMCRGCHEGTSRQPTGLREYGYKPTPKFHGVGPLFLGVELEMEAKDCSIGSLREELQTDETLYYMKRDGSLSNGLEVVSHPCSLTYHREEFGWADILQKARKEGARSHDTTTCGIHVHLSRKFFSRVEETRFVAFVNVHSANLIKIARRAGTGYTSYKAKELGAKRITTQEGRYEAVNMYNSTTLEVRIFKGTLKYESFMACLEICDAMARFIKGSNIAEIMQSTDENWGKFLQFLSGKPEYANLYNYMVARSMRVAGPPVVKAPRVRKPKGTKADNYVSFCDYWSQETAFAA